MSVSKFSLPTRKDWEEIARKITDGEALATLTYDDISIRSLYDSLDLDAGMDDYALLFEQKGWKVYEYQTFEGKVDFGNLESVGAQGVWLKFLQNPSPKKLKEIAKTDTDLFLDAGPFCFSVAEAFLEHPNRVFLNLDPIATLAKYGQLAKWENLGDYVGGASELCIPIGVDASAYSMAGATEVEQLCFGLATGVQYLRELEDAGIDLAQAASKISFTFAVTPEMFKNIALLRAFRICWAKILACCGIGESYNLAHTTHVNTITSPSYFASQDKWTNLLRTITQCFGAILGGANNVTVLPLDHTLAQADDLSKRLALNVSHILREESHLFRVNDPARGSFYLESLTQEIAKTSWQRFQEIEAQGSMLDFLVSGKVKEVVDKSWEKQKADIEAGEQIIVGVNEFQNLEEESVGKEKMEVSFKQIKNPDFEVEPLLPKYRSDLIEGEKNAN